MPIIQAGNQTAETLWLSAERIRLASLQNVPVERLQRTLTQQTKRLSELLETVEDLRQYLAEITIAGIKHDYNSSEQNQLASVHLRSLRGVREQKRYRIMYQQMMWKAGL